MPLVLSRISGKWLRRTRRYFSDVQNGNENGTVEIQKEEYEFNRRYGEDLKDCGHKLKNYRTEFNRLSEINSASDWRLRETNIVLISWSFEKWASKLLMTYQRPSNTSILNLVKDSNMPLLKLTPALRKSSQSFSVEEMLNLRFKVTRWSWMWCWYYCSTSWQRWWTSILCLWGEGYDSSFTDLLNFPRKAITFLSSRWGRCSTRWC